MPDNIDNVLYFCTGNSAAFGGSEDNKWAKLREIYHQLDRRIQIFVNCRSSRSKNKLTLQNRLDAIGKEEERAGTSA